MVEEDDIDGVDAEKTSYHIHLRIEGGLLEGECVHGIDGPLRCFASSLTWDGQEFLDKVQSSGMWERIKATAREKGLSLSFDVIKAIAVVAISATVKG